ncbi:helix-turn-helix domain-containing protein [Chloroflexia bacterium SDU3-3]|nr:helix-turn-helix domain-containing protein [Chloroflexia bacterium SDU3-3]
MSGDSSAPSAYPHGVRPTIGVFGNRQIYEGTTIAPYERTLLRGIRAAAQAHGCSLLLACGVGPHTAPFEWLPAWPRLLPSTNFVPVGPWNTSGLIAIPPFTATQQALLRSFMPEGFPLVFTSPQPGCASIGPDNALGIAHALAHLAGHGHRRIAFIAADAHPEGDGAERLAAYQQALAAHGLPFEQRLVGYGGHNQHDSYDAVRQLLAEGIPFTAVLASNDESAAGALGALRDAGLRVPQDVAVIGFDDVQHAKAQVPPLTTVRHPTFELGYRAVELLLERIRAPQAPPSIERIPTQLIIRESCGCQPTAQPWPSARPQAQPTLAEAMASALLLAAPGYDRAALGPQCRALAEGWQDALAEGEPQPFAAALDQILHGLERVDDTHGWQAALGALASAAPQHRELAAHMLDRARERLGDHLHRQHTRRLIRDAQRTERLGLITSQLLTAIEPQQILDILDAHLPTLGLGQISIALFAASEGDPVAWSDLYVRASGALSMRRFASRSFPPQGMYDPAAPFSLALLPLIIEGGPSGFVVFDAADLEICGLIVRHIAAAFRNSRLHADALLGRQLAEEASRMKSRFLSTVSHELRTPLNLIVGLSEMLLHAQPGLDALPDPARQDLERIFANAQHLGRLIGDVLDLASSEAGQLRLYQENLDLAEVLDVVAATGQQLALEKGLAWRVDLPPAPVAVRGDRTRLRQVALNFISNAVKFTEQGGVALRLSVEGGQAIVAVSDSGPGVPLADQGHIFDEFRASERTADRGYGGLGLGLAICKQLVERHGGTIGVQSSGEEESGATFFFSLPLLATAHVEPAPPATPQQLVVCLSEREGEDDGLADILGGQGRAVQLQRVDAASDWLPRLIAQPPSALVLDEPLASARGWEIMAVLKRHPATAAIPVLMHAFDAHIGRGALLELDYLLKPLSAEQLARALRQQGDGDGASKSILVVDDDGDTRALHARLVQQQLPDHRVIEASNGREALAILRHTTPSLVLLDLLMPELDGFGVIEAMRASEATRDVPVVVLTAQILTGEDMARLNAGVASILSKGLFSLEEIQGHVELALARQRRLSGIMQQVVRQAVAFIHTHYDQPITRDQLAAEVGVSGDHLTASFRQEMGITPIAYLNRYRVSRARQLLETTSRSVTDIALAVGCPDLPNFSRLFHREVGMPPNAYRRAKQQ